MEHQAGTVESESHESVIHRLEQEHHDLEEAIARLEAQHSWSVADELEIRRLKKLKLLKKDQITGLRRHN